MTITNRVRVDIIRPYKQPEVYVKQGDIDSRVIVYELYNGQSPWTIPEGTLAEFHAKKPDNTFADISATVSGNNVTVTLDEQVTAVGGAVFAEVTLTNGDDVVSTFTHVIKVQPRAVPDDAIESAVEITAYREIVSQMTDILDDAEDARDAAQGYAEDVEDIKEVAQDLLDQMMVIKGSPLVAATVAEMTDTDRVYVYTGSEAGYTAGSWYYYDGDSWEVGGVYNSVAVQTDPTLSVEGEAADAKAAGDGIEELQTQISVLNHKTLALLTPADFTENGYIGGSNGAFVLANNHVTTPYIEVKSGDKFYLKTRMSSGRAQIAYYTNTSGAGFQAIALGDDKYNAVTYTVAADGYVRFSASYPEIYPIIVYYDEKIPDQFENEIKNNVFPVNETTKNTKEVVDGTINNSNYKFEIGAIATTTNGWVYSDNSKRVRTANGTTILLGIGDKIKLKTYDGYRINIAWYTLGGNYGDTPWRQSDYECELAGYYVIQITTVPESVVVNINDYVDLLVIERLNNLETHSLLTTAFSNIKVTNHKGFSSIAPEDTLPAYLLSKEMGYDTVECDISFTSDRVPVLLHDETIDRTSNGTGYIYNMTYSQVREYDFGSWKNAKYAGTKIPSFEEFVKFLKYAGLKSQCELKATDTLSNSDIETCVNIVKNYAMEDAIIWTSNSTAYLGVVSSLLPKARLGVIAHTIGETTIGDAAALKTADNEVFITVARASATAENIAAIKAAGLPLEVFLVNTKDQLESLDPYVSGITTDVLNVPALAYVYAKALAIY